MVGATDWPCWSMELSISHCIAAKHACGPHTVIAAAGVLLISTCCCWSAAHLLNFYRDVHLLLLSEQSLSAAPTIQVCCTSDVWELRDVIFC
jgi:hypothetical protein